MEADASPPPTPYLGPSIAHLKFLLQSIQPGKGVRSDAWTEALIPELFWTRTPSYIFDLRAEI